MNGLLNPNGCDTSPGMLAAVRVYGYGFCQEIVACQNRYCAGDHDHLDSFRRSSYATSAGTIVLSMSTAPPWYAYVRLKQEL